MDTDQLKEDLSTYHGLLGDLFPNLPPEEAWERFKLSEEQLEFYAENGYLTHVKLLEMEQVEVLRREMEALMDPAHPKHRLFYEFHSNESSDRNTVLFHSLGHWRISPGFHDILWNPRFVVVASQLLGVKSVRFWHDQLFYKPPKHGGVVAWHQDYSYWTRTTPLQHLTCWVGLDEATAENGCLQYIPGSHRWDLLDSIELAGEMDSLVAMLTPEQRKQYHHKVYAEMPAGYGCFHHPRMVHGSYANTSGKPRRAFVINVFADGTRSNTNEELLAGVPPIPKGNKMEGQFFPLLFDIETVRNE